MRLDPQTVQLTFASEPPGLAVSVGGNTATTPFNRTVIRGSTNSISTATPQFLGSEGWAFSSWSDGGARSHDIVAPDSATTYTARFVRDSAPPVPGLVAAYGFDEATGLTVGDRSPSANTGTISGATRALAGRFGGGLSFDGVNDWVTVPDAPSLDLTSGMTLEGWVRPTAGGSTWRTLMLKEQAGNLIYGLYSNEDSARPSGHVFVGGGDRDTRGTAPVALNAWTHLASTYDGSALRLFVNGVQVSTRALAGPIAASTGALRIGGNAVWPEWFQGLIDEVRVYNRALTPAEIQSDMSTPIGAPAPPDTQAAHGSAHPLRHGRARAGQPELGCLDRQRGRHALQPSPRHHGRLHAFGGQPHRPGGGQHIRRLAARARHLLLPGAGRGRGGQPERPLAAGAGHRHERHHGADGGGERPGERGHGLGCGERHGRRVGRRGRGRRAVPPRRAEPGQRGHERALRGRLGHAPGEPRRAHALRGRPRRRRQHAHVGATWG